MTVVLGLATVVVLVVLVVIAARYGADSRTGADPTGRDAAWPDRPVRHHTPRADLRALHALTRLWVGQLRAHEAFDRHQRPWEQGRLTPRW